MFDNWGANYESRRISNEDFLLAYAPSSAQFYNITKALKDREHINYGKTGQYKFEKENFELTDKGRDHAKLLISNKPKTGNITFPGDRPKILFCNSNNEYDESFAIRLEKIFLNNDYLVIRNTIPDSAGYSKINNIRSQLKQDKINYFLFLQSYKSNIDNIAGDILTIAIEHQSNNNNFQIYVAKLDESPITRPRLVDFPQFDVRVIPNRETLVRRIASHWISIISVINKESKTINSKDELLDWLKLEANSTQKHPIVIYPHKMQPIIKIESEILFYLNQLKNEGKILFEANVGFGNDINTYIITILNFELIKEGEIITKVKKPVEKKIKNVEIPAGKTENQEVEPTYIPHRNFDFFNFHNKHTPVIGVKEIATQFANIILNLPSEEGMMLGIFGRWGRGKTYLMDQVCKVLSDTNKFHKVDFHNWKYQDTPASWAYLYETLADEYFKRDDISKYSIFKKVLYWFSFKKITKRLNLNLQRLGGNAIVWVLILITLNILFYYIDTELKFKAIKSILTFLGSSVILLIIIYLNHKAKALSLFKKYSQKISFDHYLGAQAEIQKEIKHLLKAWISNKEKANKKILLLVDDLDRCNEEKIIQIIDSLRVMLQDTEIYERIVVVVAVDETVLKRAIKAKYFPTLKHEFINELNITKMEDDFSKKNKILNDLVNEYIDKLFIGGIKLGNLNGGERIEIFEQISNKYRETIENKSDKPITNESDNVIVDSLTESNNKSINTDNLLNDFISVKNASIPYNNILTPDEDLSLKEALANYTNATPRQIKIIFFRHLLARNILFNRYKNNKNIWNDSRYFRLLPKLIIKFSHDLEKFNEEKENILNSTDEKTTVENNSIPTKDYKELLNILEMVIPY